MKRSGIQRVEQTQHRAGLGRVGLEPIAVEVVILRRGAPTHLGGAVLVDAVIGGEPLVAVHAVDRYKDEDRVVEQAVRFYIPL